MLRTPPGFFASLFTLGIARARWIAYANDHFNQGGAGFWFAWLLQPFANYGLAQRFNVALAAAGTQHRESPVWCFLLTGWPFIGSKRRMKRATERLNDALRIRQQPPAAAVQPPAAV